MKKFFEKIPQEAVSVILAWFLMICVSFGILCNMNALYTTYGGTLNTIVLILDGVLCTGFMVAGMILQYLSKDKGLIPFLALSNLRKSLKEILGVFKKPPTTILLLLILSSCMEVETITTTTDYSNKALEEREIDCWQSLPFPQIDKIYIQIDSLNNQVKVGNAFNLGPSRNAWKFRIVKVDQFGIESCEVVASVYPFITFQLGDLPHSVERYVDRTYPRKSNTIPF